MISQPFFCIHGDFPCNLDGLGALTLTFIALLAAPLLKDRFGSSGSREHVRSLDLAPRAYRKKIFSLHHDIVRNMLGMFYKKEVKKRKRGSACLTVTEVDGCSVALNTRG